MSIECSATHNAHLQAMFLSAFSKTLDHYGGTNANYLHQVVGEEIRHPFHHTANIILDCSRKLIQRYENIDIGDHLQTRSLGITDRWNVDCQRLNKLFSMEMKKTGFQTKRALGGNHKIPKKYGGEQGSPAGIDLWTRFAVQPKKDGGVEPAHREHWASTARRAESGVRRLMKNV